MCVYIWAWLYLLQLSWGRMNNRQRWKTEGRWWTERRGGAERQNVLNLFKPRDFGITFGNLSCYVVARWQRDVRCGRGMYVCLNVSNWQSHNRDCHYCQNAMFLLAALLLHRVTGRDRLAEGKPSFLVALNTTIKPGPDEKSQCASGKHRLHAGFGNRTNSRVIDNIELIHWKFPIVFPNCPLG